MYQMCVCQNRLETMCGEAVDISVSEKAREVTNMAGVELSATEQKN